MLRQELKPWLIAAAMLPAMEAGAGEDNGSGAPPLELAQVARGLVQVVAATHGPGDPDRMFVAEKRGRIMVLDPATGSVNATPFLDIQPLVHTAGSEQGLLGLAFHPDYDANGRFFVHYTGVTQPGETVVAEYRRSEVDPDVAVPAGDVILTLAQPTSVHQGGWLGFGPDGFLYVGLGDGGTSPVAQDPFSLLGKILRVDIDADDFPFDEARDYGIPRDNPFAGGAGAPEVWVMGLRNPWRCAFDRETGHLYIGEVGQTLEEEICFVDAASPGGENFGWPCIEGDQCTGLAGCDCLDATLVPPIHAFEHLPGPNAVIGGPVYRGTQIPALQGTYLFCNWGGDHAWSFRYDPDSGMSDFTDRSAEFDVGLITSFGEDADGELYVCTIAGAVYRVLPGPPPPCTADFDGSGDVGVDDLVIVIQNWGPCPVAPDPCPLDVDGDGLVDVDDLVAVILGWGPC